MDKQAIDYENELINYINNMKDENGTPLFRIQPNQTTGFVNTGVFSLKWCTNKFYTVNLALAISVDQQFWGFSKNTYSKLLSAQRNVTSPDSNGIDFMVLFIDGLTEKINVLSSEDMIKLRTEKDSDNNSFLSFDGNGNWKILPDSFTKAGLDNWITQEAFKEFLLSST